MSNKSDKHSHSPTISECESKIMQADGISDSCRRFESNIFRLRRHSWSDAGFSDQNDLEISVLRECFGSKACRPDRCKHCGRVWHAPGTQCEEGSLWTIYDLLCNDKESGAAMWWEHFAHINLYLTSNHIWHHISAEIRVSSTAFADWRLEPLWGMTPALLRQPNLRSSVARHRSLVRCISKPGHGYHEAFASTVLQDVERASGASGASASRSEAKVWQFAWQFTTNPWQTSNRVRQSPSPSQEMANGSTMTLKHRRGQPVIKYHVAVVTKCICSCYIQDQTLLMASDREIALIWTESVSYDLMAL